MQVKDGFVLRKVGVQYIVAPTGDLSKEFNGMLRLNETGAFLFEQLIKAATEEELVATLINTYETTATQAWIDVKAFVKILQEADLMKGGEESEKGI